ncbi:MAG: DUF3810 domain-containing protein [Planctomycetes bacterium]|nr:DUF3810 domain-containing protein [Planctomycetota bacterium]
MSQGDETVDMQSNKKQPLPIGWFALFTPSDAMPRDRGLYVKRRGVIILIGVVVLAIAWGLGQSADFVENVYADGFGQSIGRGLATVSGVVPTSLAEVVITLLSLWLLVHAARAAWHVGWRKRRALNAVACGGLHFGAIALTLLALFYVFWGLNYSRAPLIERQDWTPHAKAPENREAQTDELAALCEELVLITNQAYTASLGTEDYGGPSSPRTEWINVDRAIDAGYGNVRHELQLDGSFAASRGPAKPVALSVLMDYLQIGGFYFPWTGEANYNRNQPEVSIPFVIAHEKAHQRCITSEDEANFMGFLACTRSGDAYVAYSGYLFAQRQLLGELAPLDPARTKELIAMRVPGVQRDVDAIRAYWREYETGVAGFIGSISTFFNDTYLKANKVEGGVQSYRLSAKLLVVYARKQGTLLWAPKNE